MIASFASHDRWISYIVPSGGDSRVFGRGGEQPPSRTATLRRQVTITGRISRLLAMEDLLAIDFDAR
jgi:hypothetical protein